MTVPGVDRRPTRLDLARAEAEAVLGARAAARVQAFPDGGLHVRAGEARRFLAWLADFAVFALATGVGLVALGVPYGRGAFDRSTLTLLALAVLIAVPLLYGLCYRNGRALGGVLTGTRLVRIADGGRIGAKGPWAMTVRTTLLPLLLLGVVIGSLAAGSPLGSPARTSVDHRATARLHAAGLRRLT
ncbi:RDD family protein [Actinosynnema sp. NPDC004786]